MEKYGVVDKPEEELPLPPKKEQPKAPASPFAHGVTYDGPVFPSKPSTPSK